MRVAVDVPALADLGRDLDYLVPTTLDPLVRVGTVVRVPLHGRRAGGWVVEDAVEPPAGVKLLPLAKVRGWGPSADVVELSQWAAWRWAGRRTAFLRAATAPFAVRGLPPAQAWPGADPPGEPVGIEAGAMVADALAAGEAILRLPPAADPWEVLRAVCRHGPALIVCPAVEQARDVAGRLRRASVPAALVPDEWPKAAAGVGCVVGARAAAWAPAPGVVAVVVLDAHDTALVEERVPTWSAWEVCAERARRAGVPCILVSACPTVEQLRWGRLVTASRSTERAGWAALEIVDRRAQDPRTGLLGERLVPALRSATPDRRTVCVLNRKGRVRLLACRSCGALTLCEHCGGPVAQGDEPTVVCRRCGRARPAVCQVCGSSALKAVRVGVTKLAEDVAVLARLPAAEVTAEVPELPAAPVLVGTEAVLHRLARPVASGRITVGAVVFLDFDAEILAPRLRAAESALGLLARAARLTGGRGGGTVIVQTRQPEHPVLQAALRADPGRLAEAELRVRIALGLPPITAMAEIRGDADAVASTITALNQRVGVTAAPAVDGTGLVTAPDHTTLCDALAAVPRPSTGKVRFEVDPLGI